MTGRSGLVGRTFISQYARGVGSHGGSDNVCHKNRSSYNADVALRMLVLMSADMKRH